MAHLIPVEAVREHQLAEHNYELVLQQRRAMKIAQFANHEVPLIVSKFIEKMMSVDNNRLYGNVLCLSVFEDLRDFKNSIVCTYELRRALQRVDPRVTDVYMGIDNTYGTPHAEDLKMFDVFVFFENPEPREEETAG
jgi:hypothetical protein